MVRGSLDDGAWDGDDGGVGSITGAGVDDGVLVSCGTGVGVVCVVCSGVVVGVVVVVEGAGGEVVTSGVGWLVSVGSVVGVVVCVGCSGWVVGSGTEVVVGVGVGWVVCRGSGVDVVVLVVGSGAEVVVVVDGGAGSAGSAIATAGALKSTIAHTIGSQRGPRMQLCMTAPRRTYAPRAATARGQHDYLSLAVVERYETLVQLATG